MEGMHLKMPYFIPKKDLWPINLSESHLWPRKRAEHLCDPLHENNSIVKYLHKLCQSVQTTIGQPPYILEYIDYHRCLSKVHALEWQQLIRVNNPHMSSQTQQNNDHFPLQHCYPHSNHLWIALMCLWVHIHVDLTFMTILIADEWVRWG